jgi:hypothetical protein
MDCRLRETQVFVRCSEYPSKSTRYIVPLAHSGNARHCVQSDSCFASYTVFNTRCSLMKYFCRGSCFRIQGDPFLRHVLLILCLECDRPMQKVGQTAVVFQEEAAVPFTVGFPSEDRVTCDSSTTAKFMSPECTSRSSKGERLIKTSPDALAGS